MEAQSSYPYNVGFSKTMPKPRGAQASPHRDNSRASVPHPEMDHDQATRIVEGNLIIQKKQIKALWPPTSSSQGQLAHMGFQSQTRYEPPGLRQKSKRLSPENRIRITRNRHSPTASTTSPSFLKQPQLQAGQRPNPRPALPKNRWDVGVNMKGIGGGPQTSPEHNES